MIPFKVTGGALVAATLLGITTSAVLVARDSSFWVTVLTAVVVGSVPLWAIKHQGVGELVVSRLRYSRRPRGLVDIVDQRGTGTTWGNGEIGVYVELDAAPFAITVMAGSGPDGLRESDLEEQQSNGGGAPRRADEEGSTTATAEVPADATLSTPTRLRSLPLTRLAEFLNRSGINAAHLRVITNGFVTATESRLAEDYLDHIPLRTPPPINHTTVIEASVSMQRSMQAIYNRMIDDNLAQAASRTTYMVAARIIRSLSRQRIDSHILTQDQIRSYHDRVLDTLNEAIAYESVSRGGGEINTTTTYVAAPGQLHHDALGEVYDYGATVTSSWDLVGNGPEDATVDAAITVAAPTADRVHPPRSGRWYAPLYRQGNLQTRALPLAVTVASTAIPTHRLTQDYDDAVPVHGAGVYLGATADGAALFLNTQTGGRTQWMCAAPWHLNSLLARLSLAGIPVNVTVPAARTFIQALGSPWVTYDHDLSDGGVLVIDADHDTPPHPIPSNVAVIAYSPRNRPEAAPYLLYPITKTDYVIKSLSTEETFHWELTPTEFDLLEAAQHLLDIHS